MIGAALGGGDGGSEPREERRGEKTRTNIMQTKGRQAASLRQERPSQAEESRHTCCMACAGQPGGLFARSLARSKVVVVVGSRASRRSYSSFQRCL